MLGTPQNSCFMFISGVTYIFIFLCADGRYFKTRSRQRNLQGSNWLGEIFNVLKAIFRNSLIARLIVPKNHNRMFRGQNLGWKGYFRTMDSLNCSSKCFKSQLTSWLQIVWLWEISRKSEKLEKKGKRSTVKEESTTLSRGWNEFRSEADGLGNHQGPAMSTWHGLGK